MVRHDVTAILSEALFNFCNPERQAMELIMLVIPTIAQGCH